MNGNKMKRLVNLLILLLINGFIKSLLFLIPLQNLHHKVAGRTIPFIV